MLESLLSNPGFRLYTSDDVATWSWAALSKTWWQLLRPLRRARLWGKRARHSDHAGARPKYAAGCRLRRGRSGLQGLAGLGDLLLTCTSDTSRNRRLELALAGGQSIADAAASVESVQWRWSQPAPCPHELAARMNVEMPICSALYAVFFEGKASGSSHPKINGARLPLRN